MSWKHGSQLTITSVSRSKSQPTTMASALATMLACVIWTALGEPVEPDVSCINATSWSKVSSGSMGAFANSDSIVSTVIPSPDSTGAAAMNGSETTTAFAEIMSITAVVSSAHRTRSVRGVGW
jgi:hypothetical protein